MVRALQTPSDEIDRINERIERESGFKVQDRDSYDLAFNDIMDIPENELTAKQKKLRNEAFDQFLRKNPDVSSERIFTSARGKQLERDRRQTAKKVVTTTKEFKKQGASDVDLKGFDTARQKFSKRIAEERRFTVPSRLKGKVVFSERTFVTVLGRRQVRFRDPKGRFVSGKKN